MALTKLLARPQAKPTAIAWAVACDLRRLCTRARTMRWPAESLTSQELRHLEKAQYLFEQAEREICSMQSSLSKRSKKNGFERGDYASARAINPL